MASLAAWLAAFNLPIEALLWVIVARYAVNIILSVTMAVLQIYSGIDRDQPE